MKSEKGQAVVEFALVLPILLILVFGIIDFGRILYTKNAMNAISQDGARYVSINWSTKTSSDMKSHIETNGSDLGLTDSNISLTIPSESGSDAVVNITYQVKYITPLTNLIPGFGTSITLTSKATFRAE